MTRSEIEQLADALAERLNGGDLLSENQVMSRLNIASKNTMAKLRAAGLKSYQLDSMRGRYYRWHEVVEFVTQE